ncbi:hypothetical protein [Thalassomonas sp. RHCl1]|uniref:hypothetical protein n=1 Tax=Thalassomonas sp. RHCl1 TaxID=2995320 RepID=UPI00248ADD87|nr:hypothetical protein [Thalassomonas sp. RHCl1]
MTLNAGKHTSLKDCTLCFGVPLNKGEYYDAADAARFDWIPSRCNEISQVYNISYEQAVEKDWRDYLASGICDILNALADTAEALQIDVRRNAGLRDVHYSLQHQEVTILIAHWRSRNFEVEDIFDSEQIICLADKESDWTYQEIKYALKRYKKHAIADTRNWVKESLSFLVDRTRTKREKLENNRCSLFSFFDTSPDIGRPWLEYVLGAKLRQGESMELRDKMHTAESIWKLIPNDKHHILDLSSCNATELTQIISVERRLCHAIAPFHTKHPQLAGHLIGKTINHLKDCSYLDARRKALDEIKVLMDL